MMAQISDSRGNAIFIVLILIILFTALYMTIGRSLRVDSGTGVSQEKASLLATEMVSYGSRISTIISMLKAKNGCAATTISFDNAIVTGTYVNAASPTGDICHVFKSGGGGLSWMVPAVGASTATTPQYIFTGDARVTSIGTTAAELIMFLPNVDPLVCQEVNLTLGSSTIPADTVGFGITPFTGSYSGAPTGVNGVSVQRYGCVNVTGGANQGYYFFYVLLPQ